MKLQYFTQNMSIFTKSSKLLVPVKQSLSFLEDKCFQGARNALKEFGFEFKDIINKDSESGNYFHALRMDTVFFHQDRFELIIDARGFKPEDIQCKITPNLVEVLAHRQESSNNTNRTMSLSRNYQLPQAVSPQEGNCCLSSEGILLVSAPWQK